ncbi:hypothetical protein N665_0024s0018 [Sinapis alba]|nr:hypothetical protein N665_0024s0018 [Sinapis alba]
MRLGYLAIFTGFIEGRKFSTVTRASLARLVMDLEEFENYPWGRVAFKVLMDSLWNKDLTKSYTIDGFIQVIHVWVYYALPEFGVEYGRPVQNKLSPPLLAYNGGKGRIFFKDAIRRQSVVLNFLKKNDINEMWPKWDHDVEDKAADHIVEVMWNENHHWTMECWEVTTVKEERPQKKARKETTVKVEESPREAEETPREAGKAPVGWITQEVFENGMKQMANAMRDSWTTYQTTSRKSSGKSSMLEDLVKSSIFVKSTDFYSFSLQHMDAFINVLRKRYTNDPHMFRSERMCILDHAFAQWWMSKYPDWVSSEPDANGLGRRLPGGAWDLYGGVVPSFCQTNKIWGIHVDDIYVPVNYKNSHWLAIWISIPKRHIVVWDSIVGCIRKAQLDQVMAPFVNMVPYLLVECAATVEERCKYSLESFTYEVANAPQCESGDCGLFALKYIECHALGFPFFGSLNPKNSKAIREKMAVDIFEEIPDAHQTEITDADVNQGLRHTDDIQTTSRRLPDDFQTTSTRRIPPDDIQTIYRRLPDDYHQTTYRRLPTDDIQTTSGRLPDDFHQKTSTRRHTYDFQTTSRRLPDDFQTTSTRRLPSDDFQTTTYKRLAPDDFQTTSRGLPDDFQKSSRRSVLTTWSCMTCFFAV